MKTTTYTEISYSELDELAQNVKPGFDFVADMEAINDTSYTFNITEKDIENFVNSEGLNSKWVTVNDVIIALIVAGYIPKGNVLVNVCW